jgi:competence protein ComEC
VIRPALADPLGSGPDLVVVSHGDLDHAGGLEGVRQAWPRVSLVGNRRAQSRTLPPCHSGRSWVWDSTLFRVLHPSPFLPYRGNDSSCVLEIVAPGGRILLPGDVGRLVERRLVRIGQGDYRLLLAPHHGSRTSSSDEFLAWARPERAVFSTGYANRFGFPHPEVTDRYARHGVTTADTSSCGGLRFVLHKDGRLESRAARRERHGFWRFPAAADCPAGAAVRR